MPASVRRVIRQEACLHPLRPQLGRTMKETQYRLRSRHLSNERAIWVREYDQTPTHLVVILDAELYRDRVGAPSIVDTLEAAGEIEPALFVFVSMESVAARWIECECHLPFVRFIEEELLPWLENAYPEVRGAQERVIVGLSYTGLAAAYVAITTRIRFTKVIAQSGSFWWNDCWLVSHLDEVRPQPGIEFYLDVGKRETQENVRHKEDVLQVVSQIEGVRRFRDALIRFGIEPKYVEFDGGHDSAAWKLTLPDALRWALPRIDRAE